MFYKMNRKRNIDSSSIHKIHVTKFSSGNVFMTNVNLNMAQLYLH